MKLFYIIILSFLLGSCIFSKKTDQLVLQSDAIEECVQSSKVGFIRDSMVVNMEIDDYQVFYRISEYKHHAKQSSQSPKEDVIDKRILLNIQKTDTTSILAYKTLEISDFSPVFDEDDMNKYFIDSFCLKEVHKDSVVFNVKICMFEQQFCQEVDLKVKDDGAIVYSYSVVDELIM